jgi:protocatechuate 3,4-dioxygenase beta subunit
MGREFRLSGRVVDEKDQPVAGAEVRFGPERKTTTTADDGTFAFVGLAFERCWVSAWKDDFYAWHVRVDPEQSSGPVLLRMSLGASFVVHAFAKREPVVGAKLVFNGLLRSTTDAHGIATARGLAPRTYHGRLLADGFADERLLVSVREDPGGVEERCTNLCRGGRVEGVVFDAKGAPVPDAFIAAWSTTEGTLGYEARSSHDGRWYFSARAGTYRLLATKNGLRSDQIQLDCDGDKPRSDFALHLHSGSIQRAVRGVVATAKRLITGQQPRRIAGQIVDAAGEPVARATLRVYETAADTSGSIIVARKWEETDALGHFDIDELDGDEYDVTIDPPGPADHDHKPVRHRVRTGDTDVKLALPPSGTVSGRVLLDGAPLPYFGASLTKPRVLGGTPIGFRDERGCFTLKHVVPGTWRLALLGPGTRLRTLEDIVVEPGGTVSLGDIVMERGQQIAGFVRDSSGAPIAGTRVIVGRWARVPGTEYPRLMQAFHEHFEAITDAQGAYLFDGIDAHRWPRLPNIWAAHPALGVSTIRELRPADAELDFVIVGAGDVEGVIDGLSGGRPTAFATRGDEPTHARMAFPDKQGIFRFEALPVGEYVVSLDVGSEHLTSEKVTVVADQTHSIRLKMATSSVRVTVIVPDGRGKDLQFEPTSESAGVDGRVRMITRSGGEERCNLDFVRPGEYRASVDGREWREFTIASAPAEQTIDLRTPE